MKNATNKKTAELPIKFAVVQYGYCVFGVGSTPEEAIADAREWLEDHDALTVDSVRKSLRVQPAVGEMAIFAADDPQFEEHMALGSFEKRGDGWYPR